MTSLTVSSGIIPARAGFTDGGGGHCAVARDHPRSRGVYPPPAPAAESCGGSSPLARGLREELAAEQGITRIIPARAGFTCTPGMRRPSWRDHPRSRGVYPISVGRERPERGSSPLARGLPFWFSFRFSCCGIIPARAGFTIGRGSGPCPAWDHPRSRGVYSRLRPMTAGTRGSSPLARGLRDMEGARGRPRRIIPARAGFTRPHPPRRPRVQDHPRSRGVYPARACGRRAGRGSSPLARGLHHGWIAMESAGGSSPLARGLRPGLIPGSPIPGIIPARAGFTCATPRRGPSTSDHPRSRGVYDHEVLCVQGSCGSSPLARGLPGGHHQAPGQGRIIPARAGFTTVSGCPSPRVRDHPRSRGVYIGTFPYNDADRGSSPLARGLLPPTGRGSSAWRIIPARAGFTAERQGCGRRLRDHPRSRGVYNVPAPPTGWDAGSSPLARGLPSLPGLLSRAGGIIPARAGFTADAGARGGLTGDHPRSRGVYLPAWAAEALAEGSSPLARGLPMEPIITPAVTGIIPARAGFTIPRRAESPGTQDHPRSRGVYGYQIGSLGMSRGSSPLARGLRLGRPPGQHCPRIIPARAGFTGEAGSPGACRTDHPRSRGVYETGRFERRAGAGSSPLARGLRCARIQAMKPARIIPARAGFTSLPGLMGRLVRDHPRSRGVYSAQIARIGVT